MAEVVLQNVTKVFAGGIKAVDNVSLRILDQEFIVLVGPSGCGKSTTLRMIAGLEEVTSGTIRIADRIVNAMPPKDRDVAMVFQNYALYPHMTVYKNMAFGLKLRGVPRRQIAEKVQAAARILGIENLLDRRPRELSGGQRQRVAVGRAIVRTPKAFLFDEPLSNLDAKLRVETRAELKKLHRRLATTTIYVTHDQEEAMTLGDRVVVMKEGVIQQCAAPLDVYNRPANRFVAGFLGTPPMNFLNGRIAVEDSKSYFDEGSGRICFPARFHSCLAERRNQPMVLGIRPESISCCGETASAGQSNRLDAKLGLVETLGDRMDLHVQTPAHQHMVCRVNSDPALREGGQVRLCVNMEQAHLFEPGDEGRNAGPPGADSSPLSGA